MNPVDHTLTNATRLLRVLHWSQAFLLLGSVCCVAVMAVGVLIYKGWVSDRRSALLLVSALAVALSFLLVLWMRKRWSGSEDKGHIVAALERSQPELQDRLNTVCYLEQQPAAGFRTSFISRIGKQASALLSPVVVWPRSDGIGAGMSLLVFLLLTTTTAFLNQKFSPWQQLRPSGQLAGSHPGQPHQPAFSVPPTNSAPEQAPWGEVRITKPGADIVAAATDSILMQVEAAANQPLTSLSWSISLNARSPNACPLLITNQQLFAVAQTNIPLPAFNLSEGDVVTYFATATTSQSSYTSDLYFLEIRAAAKPSSDAGSGGGGDPEKQVGSDLSSLIKQQQEVIRQTHRLAQARKRQNTGQEKRKGLSDTESDLANATRHLGAALAAGSEANPETAEALDKAAQALSDSAAALEKNTLPLAINREQSALLNLTRARKGAGNSTAQSSASLAKSAETQRSQEQNPADRLDQITEFRDESAAARGFLEQTLEQQKALAEDAATPSGLESPQNLADRQKQLRHRLNDFAQRHPRPFNQAAQETRRTLKAMDTAADSLQSKAEGTNSHASRKTSGKRNEQETSEVAVTKALHELENLNSSLRAQDAQRELTDAYKLKQILDDLVRSFDQFAGANTNPDPNPQVPSAARQARQTVDQLKALADRETDMFRQPLRDALNDNNLSGLRDTLSKLERIREPRQQQEVAGEARDGLGTISQAFEQSRPSALQRGADSPADGKPGESLDNALAQLKQLLSQSDVTGSPQTGSKLEALRELQKGLERGFGQTMAGQQALASIRELLRASSSDADLIRLLQQVERMKTVRDVAERPALPEGFALDPSRLPPAYRDRIQSYFQGLSEK